MAGLLRRPAQRAASPDRTLSAAGQGHPVDSGYDQRPEGLHEAVGRQADTVLVAAACGNRGVVLHDRGRKPVQREDTVSYLCWRRKQEVSHREARGRLVLRPQGLAGNATACTNLLSTRSAPPTMPVPSNLMSVPIPNAADALVSAPTTASMKSCGSRKVRGNTHSCFVK